VALSGRNVVALSVVALSGRNVGLVYMPVGFATVSLRGVTKSDQVYTCDMCNPRACTHACTRATGNRYEGGTCWELPRTPSSSKELQDHTSYKLSSAELSRAKLSAAAATIPTCISTSCNGPAWACVHPRVCHKGTPGVRSMQGCPKIEDSILSGTSMYDDMHQRGSSDMLKKAIDGLRISSCQ
jgi:hypothetical protein